MPMLQSQELVYELREGEWILVRSKTALSIIDSRQPLLSFLGTFRSTGQACAACRLHGRLDTFVSIQNFGLIFMSRIEFCGTTLLVYI